MRYLSFLLTLLAASSLVNPRNGPLHFLLWAPKLLATALAPLLALASFLLTLLGWRRRDWVLTGGGAAGRAVALRHFLAIVAPRRTLMSDAFGPDWEARLSPDIAARFSARPWRPLVYGEPNGQVWRNVRYGYNTDADNPLYADLLSPPPNVPPSGLAIIFIHGGAWRFGRRNISKFPYFRQLAGQGHLVMDIDYTLSPQASLPGMVMDVKRAIIWLKAHAAEYNLNPQRIVLVGQSAGGHLALLAAYTPNYAGLQPKDVAGDSSVRAVISFYGPPDMIALHHDLEARFGSVLTEDVMVRVNGLLTWAGEDKVAHGVSGLIGGSLEEIPEMYRLISPSTYVDADCPPTLLLHGTHDVLVDHQAAERLHQALKKAGVPVVYLPLPGCEHTFESVLPRVSPAAQTAVYYMERFLALTV
ncbi:MAG: alpha/beta hydrolase [Chloroflexota bacterium]